MGSTYYVLVTALSVLAEAIMCGELSSLSFCTPPSPPESVQKLLLSPSASCLRASMSQMP